ncbi:MAG: type II secretion system minor pseudopilin GspJ [Gammaproteobacteria bacterium]|nr:type II secretion system minor pseudopilin GspJ [Gammaproteobacteria bacterium]
MARRRHGFTLLEMLIALGVFAVIGVMSSQILSGIVDLSDTVRDRSEELEELQRAMFIISRDIEQMTRRPVRDAFGDSTAAIIIGEPLIEFTRRGWQNPLRSPRSELQRVAYTVADGDLVRQFWPLLDRGPDTEPIDQVLLQGVADVEFLAHASRGDEFRYWPVAVNADDDENALEAIELRLDHAVYGRLDRLWPVAPPGDFLSAGDQPGLPGTERRDSDGELDPDMEPTS